MDMHENINEHVPFVSLNKLVTGKKIVLATSLVSWPVTLASWGTQVEDCQVQGFQIVE